MSVTSDVSPRLLARPLRRRTLLLSELQFWIDWSDWRKCPYDCLSFPLFTCKLQVVAGLDFTATGCISGRRENAQLDVYLELMHTASLRCLPADLAGPRRPTKLPHASRSGYASRRSLADLTPYVSYFCFAGEFWRREAGEKRLLQQLLPWCKAAIISTRRLNDSTQRGFRSVIAMSNSYLPCYTVKLVMPPSSRNTTCVSVIKSG